MPTEEAGARAGAVNASAAVAAAAAAAGANTLAPSAIVEAEALLECLADLLPILEEALGMTSKVGIFVFRTGGGGFPRKEGESSSP